MARIESSMVPRSVLVWATTSARSEALALWKACGSCSSCDIVACTEVLRVDREGPVVELIGARAPPCGSARRPRPDHADTSETATTR